MASMGMQLLASAMCLLGWAGIIISCLLPMWRVTAFVGTTIITSQTMWEGIWMACVSQSTGQIQCKPYESVLALSADMQASRALIVIAIATGAVGLVLAFIGGKCTRLLDEEGEVVKGRVAVGAGAVLVVTGLLCLVPASVVAGVVVRNFYSAAVDAERREIGGCIYIGWGASILLILGGALFISSARPYGAHDADKSPSVRYLVVRSSKGSRTGSYHSGTASARSQPLRAVVARPQSPKLDTTPVWEEGPVQSERSWAPSTKSQMERAEVTESEASEAPSTKSQLRRAEAEESDHEGDGSTSPSRTYI